MSYSGSFVPLVTPFDRKGRLDLEALEILLNWHIKEGTDGIICGATTGEGASLTPAEKEDLARTCIEISAKRIPILVATGTNDTAASIGNTEKAKKLGADGCLVVTPYYNKPSQKGCYLHFQEIAKVGLPIIVYHIPHRTAFRLNFETIVELSKLPSVVAIKESSSDIELVKKIKPYIPIFSGDDDMTQSIMKEGGVGSISVTANLIPGIWRKMVQMYLENKWEEADFLFEKASQFFKVMFLETNPQCIKYALSCLGKCESTLRLPLIEPEEENQQKIKTAIAQFALPQFMKDNRPLSTKAR